MRYAMLAVRQWAADYQGVAQVAMVYIQEAHATDEWPISSSRMTVGGVPIAIAQHKTLAERLSAARDFVADYAVATDGAAAPVVVADAMTNGFQSTYAAWPIRWYLFSAAGSGEVRVTHIGDPESASYDLSEPWAILASLPVQEAPVQEAPVEEASSS